MITAKRPIILRNFQAPGDVVMLTAAVRDLQRHVPGKYVIGVQTSVPELWENNPFVEGDASQLRTAEMIECSYPLINLSNRVPAHFLHGFAEYLGQRLGEDLRPLEFKGDIHLSLDEKDAPPPFYEEIGTDPYWLISAGGKRDITIKWWDTRRYQRVVDHFRDRIRFVQTGAIGHFHPELNGVVDLRGRTSIRQLIQLVHHSAGIITPVSFLMHLAAAVEMRGRPRSIGAESRPCVVIAGGREPPHWEAYPVHQFLHTVGMLSCCQNGGCWRSRTLPLGDGTHHDSPRRLCVNVTGSLPRCMDMITAEDVIRRVELFHEESLAETPPPSTRISEPVLHLRSSASQIVDTLLSDETVKTSVETFIGRTPAYPIGAFSGRGIVICAGGEKYLTSAWVEVKMLAALGCTLPVQIWHLGESELPPMWRRVFEPLGVEFVDAFRVRRRHPIRRLGGWELKAYATVRSSFEEVMLLDADNLPIVDPSFLFETPQYRRHGALFWPDIGNLSASDPIWTLCGMEPREEAEFESGQAVIHKSKCWKALCVALWMNEHSDYFYKRVHGDKETFHLAFRKLGKSYAMPRRKVLTLKATMCQHDFNGRRIFQHRNLDKWRLDGTNFEVPGYEHDHECRAFLTELRDRLGDGLVSNSLTKRRHSEAKLNRDVGNARSQGPKERGDALRRLILRAPLNAYTGYGLHSMQMVRDFRALGYQVAVKPTAIEETFAPLPPDIRETIVEDQREGRWELVLHPPYYIPRSGVRTIYFTMWESTQLPSGAAERLNRAECVIVPCNWNAECFQACGVTVPIHVVPLGINIDVFKFSTMAMDGPCVFGAAGRLDSDPKRKRVNEVVSVFQRAFPNEADVRLHLKLFPDCDAPPVNDSRVLVTQDYFSETQLADWFRRLTCFVSLARAEGWGLMQHQALATGRPIIAARFGGVAEFFEPAMGYPLCYKMIPAEGRFSGCGMWAAPSEREAVKSMRRVYQRREEARERGVAGSERARTFSWQSANRKLAELLQELGILTRISQIEQPR